MSRKSKEWISFAFKPIEDRNLLLNFLSGLIGYSTGDDNFDILKTANSNQLSTLFNAMLSDLGYKEQSIIKQSIAKCYNTSSIYLSKKDLDKLMDDIRITIFKNSSYSNPKLDNKEDLISNMANAMLAFIENIEGKEKASRIIKMMSEDDLVDLFNMMIDGKDPQKVKYLKDIIDNFYGTDESGIKNFICDVEEHIYFFM